MKTMKKNFSTIAKKTADIGKDLTIFSIVFGALCVNAQSRIGSGDQGVQGLLAATTRQIIPGSEVVVDAPSVNENEKILVTADSMIYQTVQSSRYCVSILEEGIKIGLDESIYKTQCRDVGQPIYIRGNAKVLIEFNSSVSIYTKNENEDLIVKLSKVKIPAKNGLDSATLLHDYKNREETNKILYAFWKKYGIGICSQFWGAASVGYKQCFAGGFEDFKQTAILNESGEVMINSSSLVNPEIGGCYAKACEIYALPGAYKIRWRYPNYNLPLETTGIVLK